MPVRGDIHLLWPWCFGNAEAVAVLRVDVDLRCNRSIFLAVKEYEVAVAARACQNLCPRSWDCFLQSADLGCPVVDFVHLRPYVNKPALRSSQLIFPTSSSYEHVQ
jgi:hypothetical protein